jgi:hypothetical protein
MAGSAHRLLSHINPASTGHQPPPEIIRRLSEHQSDNLKTIWFYTMVNFLQQILLNF